MRYVISDKRYETYLRFRKWDKDMRHKKRDMWCKIWDTIYEIYDKIWDMELEISVIRYQISMRHTWDMRHEIRDIKTSDVRHETWDMIYKI